MAEIKQNTTEELTQEEVEFLEKYIEINGLFLRLEAVEADIELLDNKDDLKKLREEYDDIECELSSHLNNWTKDLKRIDGLIEEVENDDNYFVTQRELDEQEFYNDNIRGCY